MAGPVGMRVTVTLRTRDAASLPEVKHALAAYLFEAHVMVAS